MILTLSACFIASYVIGGIPFGLIIGKIYGFDVRKIGSSNIGAMNVGRVIGPKGFIMVFLLDAMKGFIPAIVAGAFLTNDWLEQSSLSTRNIIWLAIGIVAVLGHNYSIFLRFQGGKGVATSFGVALGIYPELTFPALVGLAVWALGISITRMSSVGSLCAGIVFPIAYLKLTRHRHDILQTHWPFLAFTLLACLMVVIRHRANIARIMAGTEPRVGRS